MKYLPSGSRYQAMRYNRSGRSGLKLPAISLGCGITLAAWTSLKMAGRWCAAHSTWHHAFRPGNNYAAARVGGGTFRAHFPHDLKPYRDELIISTKAVI